MIIVYQVNLKEGDLVQATIEEIKNNQVVVDTSQWANVVTANLEQTSDSLSIVPGKEIFSEIETIESGVAKLHHKSGIYHRNHLPGDSLRVKTIEPISPHLYETTLDNPRNLDSLYVVGGSLLADVGVEIVLIRGQTAVAMPVTTHDEGLASGQSVTVKTIAGSTTATVTNVRSNSTDVDIIDQAITVELTEPAPTYGPATVTLTDNNDGVLVGEIESIPANLPNSHSYVETQITQNNRTTKYEITETNAAIEIELDHSAPISGKASIKIRGREAGIFQGDLYEYVSPSVEYRGTYEGVLVEGENKAQIKRSGSHISVSLKKDVSATGRGDVRITDIADKIHGKVVGEIEPVDIDNAERSEVDMTNLSKL